MSKCQQNFNKYFSHASQNLRSCPKITLFVGGVEENLERVSFSSNGRSYRWRDSRLFLAVPKLVKLKEVNTRLRTSWRNVWHERESERARGGRRSFSLRDCSHAYPGGPRPRHANPLKRALSSLLHRRVHNLFLISLAIVFGPGQIFKSYILSSIFYH